ncbi:MAG: UDP-2,3-diacylglucosamine diphosphatase [Saprospiraceae bacterium]|nr:UDP-2,3-diacylglucosamine diphosphatase [Saprospiraceae bacterium]
MKRELDIVVISDVHLGASRCRAEELLKYLKSIQPEMLVLNGDIFDMGKFRKNNFPTQHLEVIRRVLKMALNGTKVYYLTGECDQGLRQFEDTGFGPVNVRSHLVFKADGKLHWIFHGNYLTKTSSKGWSWFGPAWRFIGGLFRKSGFVNQHLRKMPRSVTDFEDKIVEIAAEKGFDYVICGHIHHPQQLRLQAQNGKVVHYLNSGDWIEHGTALEYRTGQWCIYHDNEHYFGAISPRLQVRSKTGKSNLRNLDGLLSSTSSATAALDAL